MPLSTSRWFTQKPPGSRSPHAALPWSWFACPVDHLPSEIRCHHQWLSDKAPSKNPEGATHSSPRLYPQSRYKYPPQNSSPPMTGPEGPSAAARRPRHCQRLVFSRTKSKGQSPTRSPNIPEMIMHVSRRIPVQDPGGASPVHRPWIVPDDRSGVCICEGAIKPTQTEHLLNARGLAVQPPIAPRRLACMVPRYRPHTHSRHTGSGRRLGDDLSS